MWRFWKIFLLSSVLGLFLALLSCHPPKPLYRNPVKNLSADRYVQPVEGFYGTVQLHNGDGYSSEETGHAIYIFYIAWVNTFGDPDGKVLDALHNLTILWEPSAWALETPHAFDTDGSPLDDEIVWVAGLTENRSFIRVAERNGNIEDTVLVHELIHVAIWNTIGDGDADHEGTKYPGWTKKHTALIFLTNLTIATSRQ